MLTQLSNNSESKRCIRFQVRLNFWSMQHQSNNQLNNNPKSARVTDVSIERKKVL